MNYGMNATNQSIISSDGGDAIIYKSSNLISSMSYSGKAKDMAQLSDNFKPEVKELLGGVDGFFSVGTGSDGKWKNIHVYSSMATSLDGLERICYIASQPEWDHLEVREYSGSRGCNYSSLYYMLTKKLLAKGLAGGDSKFIIPNSKTKDLVDAINEVISERANNKYELVKTNSVDQIKIEGQYYYYNVVYWREKIGSHDFPSQSFDINVLKNLARKLSEISDIDTLSEISRVLKVMDNIVESKRTELESIKALDL